MSVRHRVPGRHFLQIPGPSPIPDRVLRAISMPVIDHRGPEFRALGLQVLGDMKRLFGAGEQVFIFPSSGTGAWEAALTNVLDPDAEILMYETGHFATLWSAMAGRLGFRPELLESNWRAGADPARIEERLSADTAHAIKAVCVVHNETSTGCVSPIPAVRRAIDDARHPALLLVDVISSLGSMDYRHDEWGVDVTVGGSQKGLMLPPGLSFNAVSPKAMAAAGRSKHPRVYWSWADMAESNEKGFFPYTPGTNLLYGLAEAVKLLEEEGLDNVFARHERHGAAVRAAVDAWGLPIWCEKPSDYSPVLTGVLLPAGHDADAFRRSVLEKFDMSLGTGLGKIAGRVFRIGHLGDTNDLTILGALAGLEMSLRLSDIPFKRGGVEAAMALLADDAASRHAAAATETVPALRQVV